MPLRIIKIPVAKNLTYFWVTFSIYFVFQYVTAVIANFFDDELTTNNLHFSSLQEEFITLVIIAPIVETLIFQYLIIEVLLNLKLKPWVCILVSALLFGVSHWYNLVYILVTTVVGLIFAYYYLALRHQNFMNKLVLITIIHALSNLFAFVNNNFYDFTAW